MRGNRCAICHDSKLNNDKFTSFQFPDDPERRRLWSERLNFNPKKKSRVCAKHFSQDQFQHKKLNRLKQDAVPTESKSNDEPPPKSPPPPILEEMPAVDGVQMDCLELDNIFVNEIEIGQPEHTLQLIKLKESFQNVLNWIRFTNGNQLPQEVVQLVDPAFLAEALEVTDFHAPDDLDQYQDGSIFNEAGVNNSSSPILEQAETLEGEYAMDWGSGGEGESEESVDEDEIGDDDLNVDSPASGSDMEKGSGSSTGADSDLSDGDDVVHLSTILAPNKNSENCCRLCRQEYDSHEELIKHSITHCAVPLSRIREKYIQLRRSVVGCGTMKPIPKPRIKIEKPEKPKTQPKPREIINYPCPAMDCTENFLSKAKLEEHVVASHPKVPLFQCEKCGKLFSRPSYLNSHNQKYHRTVQHSQVCPTCGRSFKRSETLAKHIKTVHTQIRKYKCTYCPFAAKTQQVLRAHVNRHLGKNQRQCPYCGCFKQSNNLKSHIESVHKGKCYRCNLCGELLKAAWPWEVRAHLKARHPEVPDSALATDYATVTYKEPGAPGFPRRLRRLRSEIPLPDENSDNEASGSQLRRPLRKIPYKPRNRTSKSARCEICHKIMTLFILPVHMRSKHAIKTAEYKCNFCTSEFYTSNGLSEHFHKKHVLGVQDNESTSAGVPGIIPSEYQELLATNSVPKELKCTICDNHPFSYFSQWVAHMRKHKNDPNFRVTKKTTRVFRVNDSVTLNLNPSSDRDPDIATSTMNSKGTDVQPIQDGNTKNRNNSDDSSDTDSESNEEDDFDWDARQYGKANPKICNICNHPFKRRNHWVNHIKRHKKDPNYRLVPKRNPRQPMYQVSSKAANPSSNAEASQPLVELPDFALALIAANTPVPAVFNCPYETCTEITSSWASLKEHLESLHPDYTGYGRKIGLTNNTGNIPVNEDNDSSNDNEDFDLLSCPKCDKMYSKHNLLRHIKMVHVGPEVIPVHCRVCNKTFQHEEYLRTHEKTITHRRREREMKHQEEAQEEKEQEAADDLTSMLKDLENEYFQ